MTKMKIQVMYNFLNEELDGMSVEEAIEFLTQYEGCKLVYGIDDETDDQNLQIVRIETQEEYAERIEAEKLAKAKIKLERERQKYLELKAKFEGSE